MQESMQGKFDADIPVFNYNNNNNNNAVENNFVICQKLSSFSQQEIGIKAGKRQTPGQIWPIIHFLFFQKSFVRMQTHGIAFILSVTALMADGQI